MTFYKILLNTPFKSLVFVAMGWGIVFGLVQNKNLDRMLFKELPDEREYFYALISGSKNGNDVSRKLQSLPGIALIKILPQGMIQKELMKALKDSDLAQYMDASLEQLNYQGLKVIFSSNTKEQSQNLIRDYLLRLVGKNSLTMGPVQKKSLILLKSQKSFVFFKKYGVLFLIMVGMVIWMLLGLSYRAAFRDSSYMIENFQRRRSVSFKIVLSGMSSLFLAGLLLAWWPGAMDSKGVLMAVVPFLLMIFLHAKTKEWQY